MEKEERKSKFQLKISKPLLGKTIILLSLILILVFFFLARNYRDFAENYSKTVVRFYSVVFGHISSFFPFSLFEVFVIATIIYAIAWIVFFIRNTKRNGIKNSYHMILRLGIIVLSIATLYQGTAGMEYARYDVEIPMHTKLIENPKDYKEICFSFLDDFNYCASQLEFNEEGSVVAPYSNDILVYKIEDEFKKFDSDYFHSYTPKAKPMYLTSWAYTALSISGVSFVPSVEANFNIMNPDGHKPFTIAHELAHAKGAMPEEWANLTAAYICLNSTDPYIRYSGYNTTFWSLASLVRATNVDEDMTEFYKRVDPNIYRNNSYENKFWSDRAVMDKISEWFNNLYLKMNNDKGTISYSDNINVVKEKTEYVVKSYSRYQALFMWIYFDKN